jgi:hypothetical protein
MHLPPMEPSPDDLAAIQAALDELNAGNEGLPLEDAIAEIREAARDEHRE